MQGGLLCLAAIAVGLGQEDNDRFLDVIVPPVLDSFRDPDSGVRYYGLEALYNIAKVSRESFLRYFSDTFDSLFRLCADSEHRVQVPPPSRTWAFLRVHALWRWLVPSAAIGATSCCTPARDPAPTIQRALLLSL